MESVRLRETDQQRLTRWIAEHGPALHGFLRARIRDSALVDDLLQEVFYRAWAARGRFVESGGDRAYLLTIADRLACDAQRTAARRGLDRAFIGEPICRQKGVAASVEEAEASSELRAALERLSEPQRRTLLLRFFGDLDFRSIAAALDCPVATALSHCRRGLAALRRMLVEDHA